MRRPIPADAPPAHPSVRREGPPPPPSPPPGGRGGAPAPSRDHDL